MVATPTPPDGTPVMCEARDSKAPLRQGDVFVATVDAEPRTIGIVVTSDCDIAQNKAWRSLTWVPVVSASSYAASCWTFDEVGRLAKALGQDLLGAARKSREKRELPPLSDEALTHWLRELSEESLLAPFGCEDDAPAQHRVREEYGPKAAALRTAREALEVAPPRHQEWSATSIEAVLAAVHALKRAKSPTYQPDSLAAGVSNALHSHPGDVFLLYGIPGCDADGYVALLRFVREVADDEIALQAGEALERGRRYYRVGALLSPYRYDLTRRLGAVFSDIGLPQQYADHKRTSAKRVAESLVRNR